MSAYLEAFKYGAGAFCSVYLLSFAAALGWKHGRGVGRVTNITVNAVPKETPHA